MITKHNPFIITLFIFTSFNFYLSGCSSKNASKTEASYDSLKSNAIKTDTLAINKKDNNEIKTHEESETLDLQMNDFEYDILESTGETSMYLVQTKQGFDYIKMDFNNDSINDAVALGTYDGNPDTYDSKTKTFLYMLEGDGYELQQFSYSGDLGGEGIQYKDFKKLAHENETVVYTHQSMRNYMDVYIKAVGFNRAIIDKISICYNNASCEDLYIASEGDTIELNDLNVELLDSLRDE